MLTVLLTADDLDVFRVQALVAAEAARVPDVLRLQPDCRKRAGRIR